MYSPLFAFFQNQKDAAQGPLATLAAGSDTGVPVLGWGYGNSGMLAARRR